MRILLIDTIGQPTMAALADSDGGEVRRSSWVTDGSEAEHILPAIQELLRTGARPDALACITGPGRFTSTRIGVAVANALSMAWGLPVIGMHRLSFLAHLARAEGSQALAMRGERQGEYYFVPAQEGGEVRVAQSIEALPAGCTVVDDGLFERYWVEGNKDFFLMLAAQIPAIPPETPLSPFYARAPNITTMKRL